MGTWAGWQGQVLTALGAIGAGPNLQLLNAWQACEGGSASFNPLNTTQPEPGATNYNSIGVKNYPDRATGLRATVTTLTNGFYNGIVSDLRSGGHTAASIVQRNAAEFSTWGTSTACILSALGAPVAPPPETTKVNIAPKYDTPRMRLAYAHGPHGREDVRRLNVTDAWGVLTYALGRTMPTQAQRTRDILRRFPHAIRR